MPGWRSMFYHKFGEPFCPVVFPSLAGCWNHLHLDALFPLPLLWHSRVFSLAIKYHSLHCGEFIHGQRNISHVPNLLRHLIAEDGNSFGSSHQALQAEGTCNLLGWFLRVVDDTLEFGTCRRRDEWLASPSWDANELLKHSCKTELLPAVPPKEPVVVTVSKMALKSDPRSFTSIPLSLLACALALKTALVLFKASILSIIVLIVSDFSASVIEQRGLFSGCMGELFSLLFLRQKVVLSVPLVSLQRTME